MSSRVSGTILALVAVCLFSTSALLVRLSEPVPATGVTFLRLLLAGCLVLAAGRLAGQTMSRTRVQWPRLLFYGLITGLHFYFYILSLSYTSVSNSLALVYTAPAFVAAFARIVLGERLETRQMLGIGIVICGVLLLTGFDLSIGADRVLGDGLAILSAAAFGVYSVAGRRERERYPLLLYAGCLYLFAATWLAPVAVTALEPSEFTTGNALAILGLAVLPLAMGHTLYNAALRRIPAAEANVLSTLEVIGGTFLAWLFLRESVPAISMAGVGVILLGVLAVVQRGS